MCQSRMYAVGLLVICILAPCVTGSDYLIAVYGRSSVHVQSDELGGSVRVSYINYNETRIYSLEIDVLDETIEEKIGTTLGYDASTTLISCSNNANNVTVYSGDYNYRYNVFSPLPVTALGTRYIVSSCIQNVSEHSVLVITAYKLKADVSISFDAYVEFSYDGQRYGKGDTFQLTIKAYRTFTFRVKYDLSGTRIESSEAIAVFSGTANSTTVYTYTQLLPIEQFSGEYVIAVDGSTPPFQLQILGQNKSFEITFNNGTRASTKHGFLNRLLVQNEACYFRSSRPVTATLCRSVGNQKGFVMIPPTSLYGDHNGMRIEHTTAIVTHNTAEIDLEHVTGEWKNISNSSYKVGIFSLTSPKTPSYPDSKYSGMVVTFRPESFYASGLPLAKKDKQITDPSKTFIVIVPKSMELYLVAVGEEEAFYQTRCSGNGPVQTRHTFPYGEDYFQIRFYSSCIIETNNERLNFFLQRRHIQPMSAPLLPVSSLGKEYVIPAFDVSIFSRAEIMIATGYWTASVNVTRKETVTSYELTENQTLSVAYEATGMSVSSSREIAVFTENEYKGSYERYIYSQLTPSDDFGNEYVLAVGSLATKGFIFVDNFTEEYFVNITCLFNETTIIFNDGLTVIIAEAKFYHKDVKVNGSLQFSTSRPVMAYLCLKVEFHHDDEISQENPCTILKPVEQYGDSALISIPAKAELKIMTKQDNDGFHGFSFDQEHHNNMPFITKWKNIPNADFKVGTVTVDKGIIYIKSTSKFSVIVYGFDVDNFPEHGVLLSISTSLPSDPLRTPLHSPTTGINVTAIVIGSVGFIILAFGSIIVFLLFRRRRKRKSKSSTETRKNPEERGTSSEGNQSVPETPEQGSDVTEVHTYSELNFEGQTVNEYQKIHHKSDKQTSDYTNM